MIGFYNYKKRDTMKRIWFTFAALVALIITAAAPIPIAHADNPGTYLLNANSCYENIVHSAAGNKYICYDLSNDLVYVVTWSANAPGGTYTIPYVYGVYGSLVNYDPVSGNSDPYPTPWGFVTPDANCWAQSYSWGYRTLYATGLNYNLLGKYVTIDGLHGTTPAVHNWHELEISQAGANVMAYTANANAGYKCAVVP